MKKMLLIGPLVSLVIMIAVLGGMLAIGPDTDAPTGGSDSLEFSSIDRRIASLPATERQFLMRDKVSLYGTSIGKSTATTKVILLHGSGYHGAYLRGLGAALARENGVEVLIPNLRGHYKSGPARGDIPHQEQLVQDIDDIIKSLPSATRILVAGHSSGGGLALRHAGSVGADKVDSYLLLAPYLGHDAPTARDNSGGWARPALPRIIALSILNTAGIDLLDGLHSIGFAMPQPYRNGSETLSYSWRMMKGFGPHDPVTADLASLPKHALVLVGKEDEAFHADQYTAFVAQHSKARVKLVSGADHFALVQTAPGYKAASDWIKRLDNRQ